MFDRIAPRYDLLNRVLSGGTDVRWRRRAVDLLELEAPARVLDLCTGTADLLIEALSRDPRHSGLGVDLSHAMLVRGRAKLARGGYFGRAALVGGDGEHLPVRDGFFDGALVAFGIRNVGDPVTAMREVLRVLRPGGRFVVLEFSTPGGLARGGLPLLLAARAAPARWPGERRRLGLRLPPGLRREVPGSRSVRLSHAGGRVRRRALEAADRRDRVPPPGGDAAMSRLGPALQRAAEWLRPGRDAVLGNWVRAVADVRGISEVDAREGCTRELDALLDRLSAADVEGVVAAEALRAEREVRRGASLLGIALDLRVLDRCLAAVLASACPDRDSLAETLVALDELGDRRLEALLAAQEDESARRLVEAQEQAAKAKDRAREVQRANEALRRAEAQSRHRAEQIGLLSSVAHRIAAIREPEELMQQAADQIRARMNHTYVAVVVVDDEGVLVGRWAGRPGLARSERRPRPGPTGRGHRPGAAAARAAGRGRRRRATPTTSPTSPGRAPRWRSRFSRAIEALGVLDFQSEQPFAFALDDVAAGETLAEFLVIALRNARLYQDARKNDHG